MEKRYAVYQITDPIHNTQVLVQEDLKTIADAEAVVQRHAGGRYIIQEYYNPPRK